MGFQGLRDPFSLGALPNSKQRIFLVFQPAVTDGVLINVAHNVFQLGFGTARQGQFFQPSFDSNRSNVPEAIIAPSRLNMDSEIIVIDLLGFESLPVTIDFQVQFDLAVVFGCLFEGEGD